MTTMATARGQVPIPAALRRKLGIKPGTRIHVYEDQGRIVIEPVKPSKVEEAFGMFKGAGALRILMEERKREREL
jgi:AbrB family looped-hinge helix DNA binding protein